MGLKLSIKRLRNDMENYYRDKLILITGASGGLGMELGKKLHAFGAKIILCDVKNCLPSFQVLETHKLDVSNCDLVATQCSKIIDKWGTPDIIIANAGLGGVNPGFNFDLKQLHLFTNVNFLGTANIIAPFPSSYDGKKKWSYCRNFFTSINQGFSSGRFL